LKTFKVVTLGEAGAGKTVFMAAMFRKLGFERQNLTTAAFYLTATDTERNHLQGMWATIADPGQPWPESTILNRIPKLHFVLNALDGAGDAQPVCAIQYIDYSGERLSRTGEEQVTTGSVQQEFRDHIHEADVLLALLDGRRLLQLMKKDPQGDRYLRHDVLPILSTIAESRSSCVVHFVITKWDLLQRDRIPLDLVIDELRKNDDFAAVLANRAKRTAGVVRIIPVSSVGHDFATLRDDGRIVKVPGASPNPWNVDVPVVALLPDFYSQLLEDIRAKYERRLPQKAAAVLLRGAKLMPSFAEAQLEEWINRYVAGEETEKTLERTFLTGLVRWGGRRTDRAMEPRRRSRRESRAAEELRRACDRMFVQIETRLGDFEQSVPGSKVVADEIQREATI
jgi:hypothetical protein